MFRGSKIVCVWRTAVDENNRTLVYNLGNGGRDHSYRSVSGGVSLRASQPSVARRIRTIAPTRVPSFPRLCLRKSSPSRNVDTLFSNFVVRFFTELLDTSGHGAL